MGTLSTTIYQLLEYDFDFNGEGFSTSTERIPFDPGDGELTRLVFIDPEFDPQDVPPRLTIQTRVDGNADSLLGDTVGVVTDGSHRRLKFYLDRTGHYFGIRQSVSSGGGTRDVLVDESANNVVDENGNDMAGPGSDFESFRFLGQTFGFQKLGSTRR